MKTMAITIFTTRAAAATTTTTTIIIMIKITENGQNTEKSPGDLRRLAVTQTPVKNHLLTLM